MGSVTKQRMLALQTEILEAVATGMSVEAVSALLCRRIEALAPTAICTIVGIDHERRLRPIAAPSLPGSYSAALDGIPIGPSAGSCGTAAHLGRPVEVRDIAADPLWRDYADLALPIGLRACWSSPIFARDGRVIATFAFYYRSRRGPGVVERQMVATCVHLCAIAIAHGEAQRRNHELAHFDQLTGLPNRWQFQAMLADRLAAADAFGLLLVDLDRLKAINDTMGHVIGDQVIREVAARIRRAAPAAVTCRLAGDEFALLVDGCRDHAALQEVAASVLHEMRQPFVCDGNALIPQVTVGGVVRGADGTDPETLCQNADFALHHAKEIRRGGHVAFEPGLRTSIMRRMGAVREVDQALAEDRILVHYQPQVRLDSGGIVGLEALARMRLADGRVLPAMQFFPAFADHAVAHRLTDRMLAHVAADMRAWLDRGIDFQNVGVNVSTADFRRGDLGQRLEAAFEAAGVPLHHLVLEVTETVLMGDPGDAFGPAVRALRDRGIQVALDDFGTGYASLTHLLSFPVDIIKIDRSFVERLIHDRPSAVIVEAMIELGRKLDMRIVAEGIEEPEQRRRLAELGCRLGQGFLFARPVDAAAVTRLLEAGELPPPDGTSS